MPKYEICLSLKSKSVFLSYNKIGVVVKKKKYLPKMREQKKMSLEHCRPI